MALAMSSGNAAASIVARNYSDTAVTAARSSGSSPTTLNRIGAARSTTARNRSKAAVLTTNPGGTAIPARASSPRLPPLPPTCGRSARPSSANQPTISESFTATRAAARSTQNGHDTAPAVDPDALAILDPRRAVTGTDHGRQAVLACDDGRMAHRATDVRDGSRNLAEDRRPGGGWGLAHPGLAL